MRRVFVRLSRILVNVVLCGIAVFGLLVLTMWWQHRTPLTLPLPTGALPVARVLTAWTNPSSREELAVWMWYPAASSNKSAATYLPSNWRQALRDNQGIVMRSFFKRDPAVVRAHSQTEASLPSDHSRYPVVLLRPGGSALTADFTTLAEDLASHGYVVVGFDAPARSFVFVESGGRVITRGPGSNVENANGNLDDPIVGRLLALWLSDAKAVIDQLQRLNDGVSGTFAGRLDFARLGAVGHSFGGAQALQFCHDDSRCRAAIDLDGIPFGSVVADGLSKPAMFLLSDHHREMSDPESLKVLAMIQSIYQRLAKPRIYATVRTANHFSFSDQILLNSQTAIALLRFTGFGRLDAIRGLAISNDYVRTFLDVTLKDAPPSTLKHLFERYPEVDVSPDQSPSRPTSSVRASSVPRSN